MDIFFAGISEKVLETIDRRDIPLRPNILVSMFNMTPFLHDIISRYKENGTISRLALDSGTFSLNSKPHNIDERRFFHRLSRYLVHNKDMFDIIFNFDIDYSPEGFERNLAYQRKMDELAPNVYPVMHSLTGDEHTRLLDEGYDRVAIGQCAGERRSFDTLLPVSHALLVRGVPRLHLLGIVSPQTLLHVPCSSCDASSHIQHAKYGRVNFVDRHAPGREFAHLYLPWSRTGDNGSPGTERERRRRLLCWLDGSGITWDDLAGRDGACYAVLANMLYYEEIAREATRRHKELVRFLLSEE